jgi:nicotinate-nucleotide adenylyltransferase
LRDRAKRTDGELPVFIIGCDAFAELGTWREPEALLTLAHFAITTRPPVRFERLADWLPECLRDDVELAPDGRSGRHRSAGTWIRQLEITALDISASAIRARLRAVLSIRYLVPESAREAIEASRCYAPEAAA